MTTKDANMQKSKRHKGIANLRPFKPGQSGNPNGRPAKKPITEMYERILADPKNIAFIEKAVIQALRRGNMAMVLQLKEMTDRVEGKVMQPIEADVTVNLAEVIAAARKRVSEAENKKANS
jgi:hypothetical protein